MAARAASRLMMPPGGFLSAELKHLVEAGKAPLTRFQGRGHHSASTGNNSANNPNTVPFVTVGEHERIIADMSMKYEKAIGDLEIKYDKALSEIKNDFSKQIVVLCYDLKKEGDERGLKHYLDTVNLKNEIKAMEGRVEGRIANHELKIELQFSKDETRRLKTYGWLVGASTAFLSRFSQLPDAIFKKSKGGQ